MPSPNRGIHKKHRSRLIADRTDWQTPFLKELARTAIILDACVAAGIDRQTYYNWTKRTDAKGKAFQARVEHAIEDARDVLRREGWRRGVHGVTRKQFTSRGEPIIDPDTGKPHVVTEYSDTLWLKLANAHLPECKEKQQVEHTGKDGEALTFVLTVAKSDGNPDPNPAEAG